ncbi:caib baif family enzyme [Apiospora kogelbergensis]|uniref:Caib baif family enzyme n=1 Tax=Apiospora kogelbergensis TaxID=1337665 RepID=A0AAW0Q9A1_9PEZI
MGPYTVQQEAGRIFHDILLQDARLGLPPEVHAAASHTSFVTGTTIARPFIPVPTKVTECSAALWALLATYANTITAQRFGDDGHHPVRDYQKVVVDSDAATAFTFSFLLLKLGGKPAATDPDIVSARIRPRDTTQQFQPWRRLCTNVYQCGDGRWFHSHGGLDASPSLRMLGLPTHQPELVDEMKIISQYADHFRANVDDAAWLDTECNEHWRQAGTLCLTTQEYRESAQGRAVGDDPLYLVEESDLDILSTPIPWPSPQTSLNSQTRMRPLEGIKLLDLTRAIAGPTIARLAALFGATVVRISNKPLPELTTLLFESNLGKRDVDLNLKTETGREALRCLLEDADVILDGYRPGVLERLGFGPAYVQGLARRRGKGIVYARENCYGWKGPLAHRSGWQMISDAVTGLAWEFGEFMGVEGEPIGNSPGLSFTPSSLPPLPNSDYQTGIVGCLAIMNALDRRAKKGGNYLVSVSLNQYNSFLISLGFHDAVVRDELRKMWDHSFRPRHYDDMHRMLAILNRELPKKAPSLFDPKHMMSIKAELGVEEEVMDFLGPPVSFDVTRLGYDVGSCGKGSHKPEWPMQGE